MFYGKRKAFVRNRETNKRTQKRAVPDTGAARGKNGSFGTNDIESVARQKGYPTGEPRQNMRYP